MIDVKKLAEQAGFVFLEDYIVTPPLDRPKPDTPTLKAFAALVLEAAALECEEQNVMQGMVWDMAVDSCAAAIRAMKPGKEQK